MEAVILQRREFDKLYKNYDYEIDNSYQDLGVYLYKKARYFGVDLITYNNDEKNNQIIEEIKEKYSKLGYAINCKSYKNIEDAEEQLYKSFFSFVTTKQRLKRKYEKFTSNQNNKLISGNYEYISSPYEIIDEDHFDDDILVEIKSILHKDSPQLIIVEAAAGYGKTCTAYELLNLLTKDNTCQNPIFTELSRNRSASIFRYILLDEIDLEYPSLNSQLVKHEIYTGRIPLIIDGFDELLEKVPLEVNSKNRSFEEVESMLDTIGNLLINKAKIILTTRKTAILTGEGFAKWKQKWDHSFSISIFSIKEPRIEDWLGERKSFLLKEINFPIKQIANPVLLSYLRSINVNNFNDLIKEPDTILQKYFNSLLTREIERHKLLISVDNQYLIFKQVAKYFIQFDTSVETKEWIKIIIKDQCLKILEDARLQYSENRPTVEELTDTLVIHALLDRKGRDELFIGFVNDFVFGTLIGDNIIEEPDIFLKELRSNYMIELAATAYKVKSKSEKEMLWKKIQLVENKFELNNHFIFDITLQNKLMRNFNESVFDSIEIFEISFDSDFIIEKSVFIGCTFTKCKFNLDKFKAISFLNCFFEDCESTNNGNLIDSSLGFTVINCKQSGNIILKVPEDNNHDESKEIENVILEILWNVTGIYKYKSLLKLINELTRRFSKQKVIIAIEKLHQEKYLSIKGEEIILNINKNEDVKRRINII